MSQEIVSSSNERIKRLVKLQQSRKARDTEGLFVVEEQRVLERALSAGWEPVEVYATPEHIQSGSLDPLDPTPVADSALSRASYRKKTTGLIALFEFLDTSLPASAPNDTSLFLVVEKLEKPGNLGAVLRIADAAGVTGVLLTDPVVDVFNPNVVRASTGALFAVPTFQGPFRQVSNWLIGAGVRNVALAPEASTTIWDTNLGGSCALWIGAEAEGLSPEARSLASVVARIPMAGSSDSLNASVSAAIAVFEAVRQRHVGRV